MTNSRLVQLIVAAGFILPSTVMSQPSSTPLRVYPTSPVQANSFSVQLRSAQTIQQTELFTTASVSSVWANSKEFELDYYQNQFFTGMQWQLNDKLSAELQYQYSWAGNNHLDTLTIGFHDFFNIGQNGREEAGKHQFNINSSEYDTEITDFEGETMVNAIHGYMQYQLYQQSDHHLAVGVGLYYNHVDDSPFAMSSFEQSIQLNYSYFAMQHSFFSTVGLTHRDEDDVLGGIPISTLSAAWALGYGYHWGKHEVLIQYHGFEGTFEDDSEFSSASHEVVLGYRYSLEFMQIEVTTTENVVNMDNSTDIAFGIGLRYFIK